MEVSHGVEDARARRVCFTATGLAWRIVESGNRLEIATLFAALALLVLQLRLPVYLRCRHLTKR